MPLDASVKPVMELSDLALDSHGPAGGVEELLMLLGANAAAKIPISRRQALAALAGLAAFAAGYKNAASLLKI